MNMQFGDRNLVVVNIHIELDLILRKLRERLQFIIDHFILASIVLITRFASRGIRPSLTVTRGRPLFYILSSLMSSKLPSPILYGDIPKPTVLDAHCPGLTGVRRCTTANRGFFSENALTSALSSASISLDSPRLLQVSHEKESLSEKQKHVTSLGKTEKDNALLKFRLGLRVCRTKKPTLCFHAVTDEDGHPLESEDESGRRLV